MKKHNIIYVDPLTKKKINKASIKSFFGIPDLFISDHNNLTEIQNLVLNKKNLDTDFIPITERMKIIQDLKNNTIPSQNEITKLLIDSQGIKK